MLYHMITGKELTINDLWQKNGIRETDIIEVKGQISSVIFEHQEQDLPHNPYDQEVRELDSIRHGDVEMLNRSLAETYRGEVGQLAKNQVRQSKNIAIYHRKSFFRNHSSTDGRTGRKYNNTDGNIL